MKRSTTKGFLFSLWILIVGLFPVYLWQKGELSKIAVYILFGVVLLGAIPIGFKLHRIVEFHD